MSFDRDIGLNIVRGGEVPNNRELRETLPGALSFVVRWTGDTNLNLGVSSPGTAQGETIYPLKGLTLSETGGWTRFSSQQAVMTSGSRILPPPW